MDLALREALPEGVLGHPRPGRCGRGGAASAFIAADAHRVRAAMQRLDERLVINALSDREHPC